MDSVKQALAAIRQEAVSKGWRVEKGKRYWKMWCPSWCGQHMQTMHLTPGERYPRNLLGQLRRATCWDQEPPGDDDEEAAQ